MEFGEERFEQVKAVERLFARADKFPSPGPIDWDAEKETFERELPPLEFS